MSKSFGIHEISDRSQRAAAAMVDEQTGKTGNGQVTEKDLDNARKILAKHDHVVSKGVRHESPLAKLMDQEIDILRKGLPELSKYLHEDIKGPHGAFASSLTVDSIRDHTIRAAASTLSEAFGGGADINLTELESARDAIASLEAGTLQTENPELAEKLKASALNSETFAELELFMFTGKGGLINYGPFSINGRAFEDVFKLPPTGEILTVASDADATKLITYYEQLLGNTGYDRIYTVDNDFNLYVALNPHGELKDLRPGYRVTMPDHNTGEVSDAGKVLQIVDVDNSMKEATIGFWKDVVVRVARGIKGALNKNLDGKLELAAANAANGVDGAKKDGEADTNGVGLKEMLVGGGLVASFGAAIFNLPVAAALGVTTLGGVTLANVVEYVVTGHHKSPFFHAAGAAVNREEEA